MPTLWFLKGRTGECFRGLKEDAHEKGVPIQVRRLDASHIEIYPPGFGFTLRGNSKGRRRQARIIQRWFDEED